MLTLCLLYLTPRSFMKARDMLMSGIIDALLTSDILIKGARPPTVSNSARRRRPRNPDYVGRPSNPWILFRSNGVVELKKRLEGTGNRYDSKKFSQELGKHWNSLPKAQQEPYRVMALEAAENHRLLHPNYKYQPKREKKQPGRGKGKKNVEAETVTAAPEVTFVPPIHPPFVSEPEFTIAVPELTFAIPDVFASVLPPSHPVPVEHRYQSDFVDGTLRPSSIFKDDPLVNFRGLVDQNTFLYSFGSPVAHSSSSRILEQGPRDFGDLGVESPGAVASILDVNDWLNFPEFDFQC
ncbi:hypothetical protein IW261DRAFT_659370 [Armillaria novae-zelandiae]|uniref:HMG box domain-containing protein n=1 Tax=Armillaria novae-zelandiae TaxID=153914 RepID=A0AA39T9I2_9AGAR|nr:hypothetical protein IW261DRAFT_659370 [Armillaria novae-zelandiae]